MPRKQSVNDKIYEYVGPIYNFVYSKLLFNEGREVAIEFLNIKHGDHVLEVGVGTGLSLPLYPSDCHVYGVDLAESMLKEAERLIKKKHLKNAKVSQMNANHLQFKDNHFDSVLGNLFISATTHPEKALLEMKRVCKPGGTIVLMNHFHSERKLLGALETAINPIAHTIGFKSNLEMLPLLQKVGLKPKEVRKVNIFNLWTAVSMVNEK